MALKTTFWGLRAQKFCDTRYHPPGQTFGILGFFLTNLVHGGLRDGVLEEARPDLVVGQLRVRCQLQGNLHAKAVRQTIVSGASRRRIRARSGGTGTWFAWTGAVLARFRHFFARSLPWVQFQKKRMVAMISTRVSRAKNGVGFIFSSGFTR